MTMRSVTVASVSKLAQRLALLDMITKLHNHRSCLEVRDHAVFRIAVFDDEIISGIAPIFIFRCVKLWIANIGYGLIGSVIAQTDHHSSGRRNNIAAPSPIVAILLPFARSNNRPRIIQA